MQHRARLFYARTIALIAAVWLAVAGAAMANHDAAYPHFERQALDSMLAPIALYPDHLLSQVLMAATYPDEVEEAARWSRARPGLSGDSAVRVAADWDWDPSVRSLTAFPDVLATMAEHMQWTRDLGEAFLAQPQDVMQTVQQLRFRAYETGALTSTEYTRVIHSGSSLIIESVQPRIVYVPHYDTRVVYGTWWWPAYPPMYWARWGGYRDVPGRYRIVHWGPGVGLAPGFFFGGFDWPRREVRVVNVHTYYYQPRPIVVERSVEVQRRAQVQPEPRLQTAPGVWRHDSARRQWREAQPDNTRPARVPSGRVTEARREPAPAITAPAPAAAAPLTSARGQPGATAGEPRERQMRRERSDEDRPRVVRPEQRPAQATNNAPTSSTPPAAAPQQAAAPAEPHERNARREWRNDDDRSRAVRPEQRPGPATSNAPASSAPTAIAPRVAAGAPGGQAAPLPRMQQQPAPAARIEAAERNEVRRPDAEEGGAPRRRLGRERD